MLAAQRPVVGGLVGGAERRPVPLVGAPGRLLVLGLVVERGDAEAKLPVEVLLAHPGLAPEGRRLGGRVGRDVVEALSLHAVADVVLGLCLAGLDAGLVEAELVLDRPGVRSLGGVAASGQQEGHEGGGRGAGNAGRAELHCYLPPEVVVVVAPGVVAPALDELLSPVTTRSPGAREPPTGVTAT